jgi:hypothetical protein
VTEKKKLDNENTFKVIKTELVIQRGDIFPFGYSAKRDPIRRCREKYVGVS